MNNDPIRIEQTLHGYSSGHSLLASSIDLDGESKRTMLLMSDMSGQSMISGFEEYITGYPIKEAGFFALAKTWYAWEMKRPGCVWTHTLLIHFSDLPLLKENSKDLVNGLFRRPSSEQGFMGFEEHISLPNFEYNNTYNTFVSDNVYLLLKPLLYQLYSSVKPLLIPAANAKEWEDILLRIWQQQWPRLKRNFTFCSGSIGFRTYKGQGFDLQVVPVTINNEDKRKEEVMILSENTYLEAVKWVDCAFEDFVRPSKLQTFFKKYGADARPNRPSFSNMCKAYYFLQEKHADLTLSKIIEFFNSTFPNKTEGNLLKMAILGEKPEPEFTNHIQLHENAILKELSTISLFDCFDYSQLKFLDRFRSFFFSQPIETLILLNGMIEEGPNIYGESAIREIAQVAINSSEILYSHDEFRHLLSVFSSLNLEFCYQTKFWQWNINNVGEILNAISKLSDTVDWQKVVDILLTLGISIEPTFFAFDPASIVKSALTSINERGIRPGHSWVTFLQDYPLSCLEWIEIVENISPAAIQQLMDSLNPNSNTLIELGLEPALKLMRCVESTKEHSLKVRVYSFALALAFNLKGTDVSLVIQKAFEYIYLAAENNELDYKSWRYLEPHTQSLSFWNDWDKCKKLIKTLAQFLVSDRIGFISPSSWVRNSQLRDRLEKHINKLR